MHIWAAKWKQKDLSLACVIDESKEMNRHLYAPLAPQTSRHLDGLLHVISRHSDWISDGDLLQKSFWACVNSFIAFVEGFNSAFSQIFKNCPTKMIQKEKMSQASVKKIFRPFLFLAQKIS